MLVPSTLHARGQNELGRSWRRSSGARSVPTEGTVSVQEVQSTVGTRTCADM